MVREVHACLPHGLLLLLRHGGVGVCVLLWSACSGKTGQNRGGGTTGEAEAREDVSGELQKNDRTESNIPPELNTQVNNEKTESGETDSMMRMKIGNTEVDVDWEDNESMEALKALCKDANVNPNKVFPHNLRHLFARTFYGLEKDIAKLADILGHSSINTTRIYIISTGDEHRRRLENMRLVI